MSKRIVSVEEGSPAYLAGVSQGCFLVSLNGHKIQDVLDYRYHAANESVELGLLDADGTPHKVLIEKDEDESLGLVFETGLMDAPRACANNCMFCFVAQAPAGLRDTIYFRDDDWRLSFLTGNYITMTNMTREDLRRLCFYHLSPMNISVHAITPDVRRMLMGNENAGHILPKLRLLANAGISMNFQIVLCKGINDGAELTKTVKELSKLMPRGMSLSVVPVGLTRHREGLPVLQSFTKGDAAAVIWQIEGLNAEIIKQKGAAFVWAADEFYVKAGLETPAFEYYEDFPQLENGVGMMSLFRREFEDALSEVSFDGAKSSDNGVTIVTGTAAYKYMEEMAKLIRERVPQISISILPVVNNFFGERVTVSGLLTGMDIAGAVRAAGVRPGSRLLIPRNALRDGEDVFLDNMTFEEFKQELGMEVKVTDIDGRAFLDAVLGNHYRNEATSC